ncbi:Uncharacterized protein ABBQ32_009180 [Trebouxia sp. C0010 RCD-2024]
MLYRVRCSFGTAHKNDSLSTRPDRTIPLAPAANPLFRCGPSRRWRRDEVFAQYSRQRSGKARCSAVSASPCEEGDCLQEEDGTVIVRDDLDLLLQVLPVNLRGSLMSHSKRAALLEVVLDLGRKPEARFAGAVGGEYLRDEEITWEDLAAAEQAVGTFGGDNRAGVQGTLHRISAIRNRKGTIVGLTCRVGRAVTGHIDMIRDMLEVPNSLLFLGRPGVGKTTVIREMARVLSDELHKRVVIVDTSNEIGGDGDVPHPAIGGARRMQVPDPSQQHKVMVEAVENHMPEIIMVDEIGTEAEALACRTIAERGVQLVATAHGQLLENLIKNPTLSDLVGGIQSVTLGDEEARHRGTQKSVLERKAPPTFPLLIEMRERAFWVTHWVEDSVDCLLHGKAPVVQVRKRDNGSVSIGECPYPCVDDPLSSPAQSPSINSVPPSAMAAAAAAAAGVDAVSSISGLDADDTGILGPPTFGSSFVSDDDPYAWAQKLRRIPDKDALQELALNGYIGEPTVSGKHREKFNLGAGTGRRSRRHNGKANARVPKA